MKHECVMKELNRIFCEVFDDDELIISDYTAAKDIDDWDSLAQITLLSEIQKSFKIKFELQDIATLQDVGEIVDLIIKKCESNNVY